MLIPLKRLLSTLHNGGASVTTFPMKRYLKSRNPALTISRRHEAAAADTVYSDTRTVESNVKMAQPFCWERLFGF